MIECQNCEFWTADDGESDIGKCRRYAPSPVRVKEDGKEYYPHWPTTFDKDSCGEGKPKATP